MSDLEMRIAALSPEQREVLLRRMRAESGQAPTVTLEVPRVPAGPVDRHAPVPLTDIQQAYWLGASGLFNLGGCGVNVYLEYEMTGSCWLVASHLDTAVREVIRRHEMLRTVVLPDGRQQLLEQIPPFQTQVVDLSWMTEGDIAEHLEGVRDRLRYARSLSDRWPLFEILVHQVKEGKIRIHFRFDGILIDGIAREQLIEEIVLLIRRPEDLEPATPVSYLDHARALAAFRQSATYQRDRRYWLEQVPSLPPWPELPLVRSLSPDTVPRIVKRTLDLLTPAAWNALKRQAAWTHITPTGAVTAAFAETLRAWSANPDFTLGIEGSYLPPTHPQIRQVIGNFATIQLLAVEDVPGSFLDRARRLQAGITANLEHEHFSGHMALRELHRVRRDGNRAMLPVLFDSVLELNHASYRRDSQDAEETAANDAPLGAQEIEMMISFPQVLILCVVLESEDGGLSLVSQAVEEVFPEGLLPELLDSYRGLLSRLAEDRASWHEARPVPARPPAPQPHGGREDARIDGTALPAPALPSRRPEDSWTSQERRLADLWEELLGRRPLSAEDDFFALGGDSLLAVRLLQRLTAQGTTVATAEFLARPTLEGMSAAVHPAAAPASEPRPRPGWLRRLWPGRSAEDSRLTPRTAGYGMRLFLFIWTGQLLSGAGTGLGSFTLGVWIYRTTGSAAQLTLMAFIAATTMLLLSPVAGVFADRWDRRRLLIATNLGAALVTFAMAALLFMDLLQPWHIYPIVALLVGFNAFQEPALLASISTLVPHDRLARANGLMQVSGATTQIVAPLLAGVLVGVIGYHGVVLIDVMTFLVAVGTHVLVPLPGVSRSRATETPGVLREALLGWLYIRARVGLLALLVLFAVTNFSIGIVQVLLTPLILSFASTADLGTVEAAGAFGALLGGIFLSVWGGPRRRVWGIGGFMLLQGCILCLGGLQASVWLIAIACFLFMFTAPVVGGCNQTIWQSKVALDLQGRVFAMRGMVASATMPIAYLASGFLADRVFEPLLLPGGALADTIGQVIGVGKGRGVGLLFILLGAFMVAAVLLSFFNPRLRRVESELPNAAAGASSR